MPILSVWERVKNFHRQTYTLPSIYAYFAPAIQKILHP